MKIESLKGIVASLRNEGYIEGELSVDPLWYIIWEPENIDSYNADYEVPKYAPEFIAFGDNGGGEILATNESGAIYTIPAIGMESKYANKVAGSMDEFKQYMQRCT
ncbi:MAG: SMI1/KNR4 family protein [Gammaproteobacteria bacterium]|nr:SMI1/KNR4 family protein [Gammaproteobacteria bacterium]